MSDPKEIAENIVESYHNHGPNFTLDLEDAAKIARAYLELKKECTIKKQDLDSEKLRYRIFSEVVEGYIGKLKKSRDVLRKSIEWYEHESNWLYPEIRKDGSRMTKTIFVMREKAREAIKADDEIMGGVK